MTTTTKTIAKRAFPDYRGRTIREDARGRVTFSNLNWDGGTRSEYRAVSLTNARVNAFPALAPWANPIEGATVEVPAGWAVVEHTWFCGKDCGLRVYLPAPAPALPAPSLPDPAPVLLDEALYFTDNGALYHGKCCGASARYTGRDISGQRVKRAHAADLMALVAMVGPDGAACERCRAQARAAARQTTSTGA